MRDAEHQWERRARACVCAFNAWLAGEQDLSARRYAESVWPTVTSACDALTDMRNMRTTDRPTFPLERNVKDFIEKRPLPWPCTLMASVLMQYIPLFRVVFQSAWCTVKCYCENIALSFHLIMCNVGCPMKSLDMHGGVMCVMQPWPAKVLSCLVNTSRCLQQNKWNLW